MFWKSGARIMAWDRVETFGLIPKLRRNNEDQDQDFGLKTMPRGLKISANRQRDGQTDRGRQTDAHGVAKRLRQHRVGLSVSIVELSSVSSSMISRSAVSLAQSTGYFYSSSRAPCSYAGVTRNSPALGQISNSSPSPASLQWRSQKFLTGGVNL